MKKILFPALVVALVAFVGCVEESGTLVGGEDDSSEATSSATSSDAESSSEADASSEDGSSSAAESSSEAADVAVDSDCEDAAELPDAEGSEDTEQDGDLVTGFSIIPIYMPTGDWDKGYAMPTMAESDGCEYSDDDCILHMSFDCTRFDDEDEGTDVVQYFGESLLNKNGWGADHEWGDTGEPEKLVGEFKGSGTLKLSSFGGDIEIELSDEYQKVEVELDFDAYGDIAENADYADDGMWGVAGGIEVSQVDTTDVSEVIWVNVKNLMFE